MPYHMEGGDTPANTKWMENCVKAVKGQKSKDGKEIDESGAIAICKVTYKKHQEGKNKKKPMHL